MEPRLEPGILDQESLRPEFSWYHQGASLAEPENLEMGAIMGLEWNWD